MNLTQLKEVNVQMDFRVIVVYLRLCASGHCAPSLSLHVLQGLMSHNVTENLLLRMLK